MTKMMKDVVESVAARKEMMNVNVDSSFGFSFDFDFDLEMGEGRWE